MLFTHSQQCIDSTPIEEPEVAAVEWNLSVGEAVQNSVKPFCCKKFEAALTLPHTAHTINDVVSRIANFQHLQDQFGWILQIRIDDRHRFSIRIG